MKRPLDSFLRIIITAYAMMDLFDDAKLSPEEIVTVLRCLSFMSEEVSAGRDKDGIQKALVEMLRGEE